MHQYQGVNTRFLEAHERLIQSDEKQMPLVIESQLSKDLPFFQEFLEKHSTNLLEDLAQYGALLFRGFDIQTEEDFENSILKMKGLEGISEAFMAEEGRVHIRDLKYVLFTNAVYKTGGTLYLGGFHSENYYSADVPAYISFYCMKPSTLGGETGLINMEKIYEHLDENLKERLEKNNAYVGKWLLSEIANRYQISEAKIKEACVKENLPILGQAPHEFVLMNKPNVWVHPKTQKKSMQINLFEILKLNQEMRKHFIKDYPGKAWFWHRLVWRLPEKFLKVLELLYIMNASFFHSPKEALKILHNKYKVYRSAKYLKLKSNTRVGSLFNEQEIKTLAQLIRKNYSSCLWQKGDILLVDNRKIMHAGMPGKGPRTIRALICNPLKMNYSFDQPGIINCEEKVETLFSRLYDNF
jgi:alpha-ketoglutarate-dependent taurine dioxygenase